MYYDIVKKKNTYIYIAQTIKFAAKSKEIEREEKKKLNSKGVSNSIYNLVTYGVEIEQFKIYIKKIKSMGFKYKRRQMNVLMGREAVLKWLPCFN